MEYTGHTIYIHQEIPKIVTKFPMAGFGVPAAILSLLLIVAIPGMIDMAHPALLHEKTIATALET